MSNNKITDNNLTIDFGDSMATARTVDYSGIDTITLTGASDTIDLTGSSTFNYNYNTNWTAGNWNSTTYNNAKVKIGETGIDMAEGADIKMDTPAYQPLWKKWNNDWPYYNQILSCWKNTKHCVKPMNTTKPLKLSAWETLPRTQAVDKLQQQFCDKYGIRILNEKRGYRMNHNRYFTDPQDADIVRRGWNNYFDGKDTFPDQFRTPDYEKVMVVEIPERSLDRLLEIERMFYAHLSSGGAALAETIIDKNYEAARLRYQNPAVQAAWEQYSLMLHLASNGKDLT